MTNTLVVIHLPAEVEGVEEAFAALPQKIQRHSRARFRSTVGQSHDGVADAMPGSPLPG